MWTRYLPPRGLLRRVLLGSLVPALRSAATFNYSEEDAPEKPVLPIELPDPTTLTHAFLLRQSCATSSEGASAMLCRVVVSVQDSVADYARTMSDLIALYQADPVAVIAAEEEGSSRSEIMLAQRCAELRKVVRDLELLFHFMKVMS
jgi:hypothetical protein